MKKRWIAFFLVGLMLVLALAVPAFAEEEPGNAPGSSEVSGGSGESGGGESNAEGSGDGKEDGSDGESGGGTGEEGGGSDGEENGGDGGEDSGKDPGDGCEHQWVDTGVTVKPTCTEPGARGYVCSLCGEIGVEIIEELAPHTYDSPCDTDCNVCGATRDAVHKFSAGWDYNSTKHWHICTVCGAKGSEGDHYPGPAATEEKDQICLTCGKVMTKKRGHTHEQEDSWKSDETGHWHPCKGCEEKLDFAAHKFSGTCGSPCTECGYVPEEGHVYGIVWSSNEQEHWRVCSLCGTEEPHAPHTFDPETQICTVCGKASAGADGAHVHEFGGRWMSDSSGHWQECACGEKSAKSAHAWKTSTPDADGNVTYLCNTCHFQKTETTESAAGAAFPVWIAVVAFVITLGAAAVLLVVLFRKPKKKGHFSSQR